MTTEVDQTPTPPDITKDLLFIVHGASCTVVVSGRPAMVDMATAAVTLVNAEDTLDKCPGDAGFQYPRERQIMIHHAAMIGTVDELAEEFRAALTRVWESVACKKEDGTFGVNPALGEASLRKQTENLREYREAYGGGLAVPALPEQLQKAGDLRANIAGCTPTQSEITRDFLYRLAWLYDHHVTKNGPTEEISNLQKHGGLACLIGALVTYQVESSKARAALEAKFTAPAEEQPK
jgi:hypothetical protein